MPTELLIIRHGKTAWNIEGRLQGSQDIELHPIGMRQAEALAERLQNETFTALYSSDLKRAAQTAERIAQRTHHQIRFHRGLRERNFGIFEGMTGAEIEAQYPEDWARFRRWDPDLIVPNGDSLRRYYEAAVACVEDLARQHPDERIVIVTHGIFISSLLRYTLGIPFSVPSRYKGFNTSINRFLFDEGVWTLLTLNDTNHLRTIE